MRQRYPNFDLMRLLLALEVVLPHAADEVKAQIHWPNLYITVPCFLAISGFLVLKSYDESGSWPQFMKKRALRVLPALITSLLLCAIFIDANVTLNSIGIWATGGLWVGYPGNQALWSLAWEEIAYVALAALWGVGAYRKPFALWTLLLASMAIVYSARHMDGRIQTMLFLMPAFLVGNLMYLYREQLGNVNPLIPWVVFALVGFPLHIPYLGKILNFANFSAVSFQAFAIVWVGMAGKKLIPFRFPDISYGLYIYHLPIIIFLMQRGLVWSPTTMLYWLPAPLLAVCLTSWYLIEKPALRLKKSVHAPRAHESLATLGTPTERG